MKSKTKVKINGEDLSVATLIWLRDLSITTMKKDDKIIIDSLKAYKHTLHFDEGKFIDGGFTEIK